MRIIIAEDDVALGRLMKRSLQDAGYHVEHYTTGDSAIEAFGTRHAEVVITDLVLRTGDKHRKSGGLGVIHWSKFIAQNRYRPVYVITLSGSYIKEGFESLLKAAKSIGADESLSKPVKTDFLLERIRCIEAELLANVAH